MPFTARARANGAPNSQTSFPNGSQLNPSLTFQGAANSGVYHAGSGNVAVSVNGTQKMIVHSNGLSVAGNIAGNIDAVHLTGTIDTSRLPANITVSQVTATTFIGNGSQLSGINMSNASLLSEGTLSNERFPNTIGNTNTTFIGNGSQLTGILSTAPLTISNVQITSNVWTVLDDTSVSLSDGYVVINGNGFAPGSIASIGTDLAVSTSYVSSNQLRVQTPTKSAGSYNVSVIRGDTTVATLAAGITYSPIPVWATGSNLGDVYGNVAFTKTLAATSDSNVTYANTSALPPQTTLVSNGVVSGNITTVTSDTTYSFNVKVTDIEFQDVSRSFQLYYYVPLIVTSVATGANYYSFAASDTKLYGFGNNPYGQLGTGTTTSQQLLVQQTNNEMAFGSLVGKTVATVTCGSDQTFVVCSDNTLHAFGSNGNGQLGTGNTTSTSIPINISSNGSLSGKTFSKIACGSYHTIVLCSDASLHAWGYNGNGQLGTGNYTSSSTPIQIPLNSMSGKRPKSVACCSQTSVVLCTDGTVHIFGQRFYGNGGSVGVSEATYAVNISSGGSLSGKTATNIYCGIYNFVFILCSDNTLHAFGSNGSGQLGTGDTNATPVIDTNTYRPSPVSMGSNGSLNGKTISTVSCGYQHTMVLCSDNTLHAFGDNSYGQLGTGTTTNVLTPVNITSNGSLAGKTIVQIAAGYNMTFVLCTDSLHAFGYNAYNQLGLTNTSNVLTPTKVRDIIYQIPISLPSSELYTTSTILTTSTLRSTAETLSPSTSTLLFRASTHGYTASAFHSRCNGYAPLFIVIKANNGYIATAYTSVAFTSSNKHVSASSGSNWLNNLWNGSSTSTSKYYNTIYPQSSLYDGSSYGPTFGGGHDMYIPDNFNTTNGYTNPYSYSGFSQTTLFGSYSSWTISEMEIYRA